MKRALALVCVGGGNGLWSPTPAQGIGDAGGNVPGATTTRRRQ
jgi:hypothetical protein